MASKFFDSLLGKSAVPKEDDYMELDLASFEPRAPMTSPRRGTSRSRGVSSLKDTPKIKDEIYNGNIVIADISQLKLDKITYERVLKDLKEVAKDVNGDIVGLGDQRYVVITPRSVKISREKIVGGTSGGDCRWSAGRPERPCSACGEECEYIYQTETIPYFSDILIVSARCPACG